MFIGTRPGPGRPTPPVRRLAASTPVRRLAASWARSCQFRPAGSPARQNGYGNFIGSSLPPRQWPEVPDSVSLPFCAAKWVRQFHWLIAIPTPPPGQWGHAPGSAFWREPSPAATACAGLFTHSSLTLHCRRAFTARVKSLHCPSKEPSLPE